jgi:hypothetical protein
VTLSRRRQFDLFCTSWDIDFGLIIGPCPGGQILRFLPGALPCLFMDVSGISTLTPLAWTGGGLDRTRTIGTPSSTAPWKEIVPLMPS